MRHVTLVCGPPCGGKSTYVAEHAVEGDIVVCFDLLAQQAGSWHTHDHAPHHREAAGQAYDELLAQVAQMQDGRAWVIRCAPSVHEREALAQRLRAEVVLVVPELDVALHRARHEGRDRRTQGVIRGWYRMYEAAAVEAGPELVTSRDW